MTWTLIQQLHPVEADLVVGDLDLSLPCVVEGGDGFRILVVASNSIPRETWAAAADAAVGMLAKFSSDGLYVLDAELFSSIRQEGPHHYVTETSSWTRWSSSLLPTVTDMVIDQAEDPGPVLDEYGLPVVTGDFVSLHVHTDYSALDGASRAEELAKAAVRHGHGGLGITDHGMVSGQPEHQKMCLKYGLRPVLGSEIYFVPDPARRPKTWTETDENGKEVSRTDAAEVRAETAHMCLWAMNDVGRLNLWAISSKGHLEGQYYKPRVGWAVLKEFGEGILASSGCLGGPLAEAIKADDETKARELLTRFLEIFPGRYYIELHTNHLPEQIKVNEVLVRLAREYGVPMIATVDHHYTERDEDIKHAAWMAAQTNKTLGDDTGMFGGGQRYHYHSSDEVREALSYLGEDVAAEAMANTVTLANRCTAKIVKKVVKPTWNSGPNAVALDAQTMDRWCAEAWERKIAKRGVDEAVARARDDRERELLNDQELNGFFLVTAEIVKRLKAEHIRVGPGRGSCAASLRSYLTDITEINPLTEDLPLERFLTKERKELPDFDIDVPTSKRARLYEIVTERWGADRVCRIGTYGRVRIKEAVKTARRVLAPTLPNLDPSVFTQFTRIADAYLKTLSGLTAEWDDLWREHAEELEPLRKQAPEVFELAEWFCGRLKSYGKHPAGLVISTDEPLTYLPMRMGDDGVPVTQFDYRALDELGLLKYDFLFLLTLDIEQMILDKIEEDTGVRINPDTWSPEELSDPQVWSDIQHNTVGIFQLDTTSGRKLTRQLQPRSLAELAALNALNRPGPLKSKLTETYIERRHGRQQVSFVDPRLVPVLGDTCGVVVYQEQVMAIANVLAGYSLEEADTKVRKPLAKKIKEKIGPMGEEFRARAIENGTDPEVVAVLWSQLEKFGSYAFGKAHSYAYAMIGYHLAWLKTHYPRQFLIASLSLVDAEKLGEFVDEARRMGYLIGGPDVNESKVGFAAAGPMVRFGLSAVKGLSPNTARLVVERAPYASYDDLITRLLDDPGVKFTRAHLGALVRIGALDSLILNRRALELALGAESSGEARRCGYRVEALNEHNLPCSFDWAAEEPDIAKGNAVWRGRETKTTKKVAVLKSPPKACTISCRNYLMPPPPDPNSVEPYTPQEIAQREMEQLGAWVTHSPFDDIPLRELEASDHPSEIEAGSDSDYVMVGVVSELRESRTRAGKAMGWLTLRGTDGVIEAVCWEETIQKYREILGSTGILVMLLRKTSRGCTLVKAAPIA